MEKIHFDNFQKSWFLITILILSIILLLIGIFEFIPFENPQINKRMLSGVGFILPALLFSRMLCYKNYFGWNRKGAVIRINSFMGKLLSFDQVKTTELNEKVLTVRKFNEAKITIDLTKIEGSEVQKLYEILVENTIANKSNRCTTQ